MEVVTPYPLSSHTQETSLVRQGSTMTQITLSGLTWWHSDGTEFANLTNWVELHVWGDSVTLALYWDNTGVACTDRCTPEAFGADFDGTITVDLILNGSDHSFSTPLYGGGGGGGGGSQPASTARSRFLTGGNHPR